MLVYLRPQASSQTLSVRISESDTLASLKERVSLKDIFDPDTEELVYGGIVLHSEFDTFTLSQLSIESLAILEVQAKSEARASTTLAERMFLKDMQDQARVYTGVSATAGHGDSNGYHEDDEAQQVRSSRSPGGSPASSASSPSSQALREVDLDGPTAAEQALDEEDSGPALEAALRTVSLVQEEAAQRIQERRQAEQAQNELSPSATQLYASDASAATAAVRGREEDSDSYSSHESHTLSAKTVVDWENRELVFSSPGVYAPLVIEKGVVEQPPFAGEFRIHVQPLQELVGNTLAPVSLIIRDNASVAALKRAIHLAFLDPSQTPVDGKYGMRTIHHTQQRLFYPHPSQELNDEDSLHQVGIVNGARVFLGLQFYLAPQFRGTHTYHIKCLWHGLEHDIVADGDDLVESLKQKIRQVDRYATRAKFSVHVLSYGTSAVMEPADRRRIRDFIIGPQSALYAVEESQTADAEIEKLVQQHRVTSLVF